MTSTNVKLFFKWKGKKVNIKMQRVSALSVLSSHGAPISVTWGIVFLETMLEVSIPLFIGLSIDGLLNDDYYYLYITACVFCLLIVISVVRRVYDTRIYGRIRVTVGEKVYGENKKHGSSICNARIGMSRELIDFFEHHSPEIITSIIQIIASLIILYSFDVVLSFAAFCTLFVIICIYLFFHNSFYQLNFDLNNKLEQQVKKLKNKHSFLGHLEALKKAEIKISDKEAILYGVVFICLGSLLIFNLVQAASISGITAGSIFSIVVYTWEYIEAIILLPATLQLCTRLNEIQNRLDHSGGNCA